MTYTISPIREEHIAGFHACLDAVAKEQRFLAQTNAPPIESVGAFVRENIKNAHPQFVALHDGLMVGWCDAIPHWASGLKHRAGLGMGVLHAHRGKGLGKLLLAAVIDGAKRAGLRRIDLEVRADNSAAVGLYIKMGFTEDGHKPMGLYHEGQFHDVLLMGLILADA